MKRGETVWLEVGEDNFAIKPSKITFKVLFTAGSESFILSPKEARDIALNLVKAAEAVETQKVK